MISMLRYHLRYLRSKPSLWSNHQASVKNFLEAWNPSASELLLFGPSGGYSLPLDFLKRFKKVIAVEPDPLARAVFEKRFHFKPVWFTTPIDFESTISFEPFSNFTGAVLFCNVLGQIPVKQSKQVKKNLEKFLAQRSWASYHDAMSGADIEFDCENAPMTKATFSTMKEMIFLKPYAKGELVVQEHLAPDFFDASSELSYRYWMWQITKQQSHLIEGIFKRES